MLGHVTISRLTCDFLTLISCRITTKIRGRFCSYNKLRFGSLHFGDTRHSVAKIAMIRLGIMGHDWSSVSYFLPYHVGVCGEDGEDDDFAYEDGLQSLEEVGFKVVHCYY